MKIQGNEIKPGMIIEHKNDLWSVLKTQHVKPGKGGAFNQVELKSVKKMIAGNIQVQDLAKLSQISDIVDNNDLSRIEILFEFYLPLTNHINLIAGYEMEDYFKQDSGYSYFLSVGYKSPLKWTL